MEFLGVMVGLLTTSTLVWAIIENVLFFRRVLIQSNMFDESVRKRTKILFLISVLSTVAMFFLCFFFTKLSAMVWAFLIFYMFFFATLPYVAVSWIVMELILLFICFISWHGFGNRNENLLKATKILLPVSVFYFGISVIIRICFEKLFNYMC